MPSLDEEPPARDEAYWTIPHSTVCRVVEALYLGRLYQRRSANVTEREMVLMEQAIADLEGFSNHTTT
jgi:hypothetical protein